MIMVLIIAFCFWYGGYAFKNPEKVWEYSISSRLKMEHRLYFPSILSKLAVFY